jgi:hypothetical protein
MMFQSNVGKKTSLILVAVYALTLSAMRARGQDAPAQPGEVKAVARISKQLIDAVAARKEIVASIPYDAIVVGFRCQGVIDGRGKASVDLNASQGEATFVVTSKGTAETYARGVHWPIVASGPAWGPFSSRTLVRFDGRKFTPLETTTWAEVHGELERVEGTRGGPVGRAAVRLLRPAGELLVPRAEKEATAIGQSYLKNFVEDLADKIVTRLNRLTPVEKSLNRLYPQTKDWDFQLSGDSRFIQAAYGPRGSAAPVLPENPGRVKDVGLELWLHTTSTEAQDLAKLSKNPLARQLVQKYLEATLPELAALTGERSVTAVGPWLVISIAVAKTD